MYTLRKLTELEGVEFNFSLGSNYSYVSKERSEKAFKEIYDSFFGTESVNMDPLVFGFITGDNCNTHPLYSNQKNFIMTESGKTFSYIKL
jgi:2-hydroxychromene-2-carboxylate isomerase